MIARRDVVKVISASFSFRLLPKLPTVGEQFGQTMPTGCSCLDTGLEIADKNS